MATITTTQRDWAKATLAHIFQREHDDGQHGDDHINGVYPLIYGSVTHKAKSGMMRRVRLYIARNSDGPTRIQDITGLVALACGIACNDQGMRFNGCGYNAIQDAVEQVHRLLELPGEVPYDAL